MAGESTITVVGNLTADPELRFTPNGAAVANFTIAQTPRHYDKQAGQWQDGETLFMRCSVWREYAENVAESLTKGANVIAQGRLKARSFDDKEGQRRTVWELEVDEVGPSLRFATATVQKANRSQPAQPRQSFDQPPQQAPAQPVAAGWGGAPAGDGWGDPSF